MLARCYSLKGKKKFEQVEREGKTFQSDSFGVAYFNRGDNQTSQFGFIVSKKISMEAVQRNRVKRALSEAVRFLLTEFKKGYDVIFLAKQTSVRKNTDDLMREVKKALEDANLLKT